MPALRTLGTKWHLSSDDLCIPAVLGSLFLATWAGLIFGGIALQAQGCPDGVELAFQAFQITLVCVISTNLVAHALLAVASSQGESFVWKWLVYVRS